MTIASAKTTYSADAFLGGRVEVLQPKRGHHRSGLEAVLLAASLPAGIEGTIVDLGSGAGVAGLCAAALQPRAEILLVERDSELVAGAQKTLALPRNAWLAERVRIAAIDIGATEAARVAAGLPRGQAAAVLTNPPFHSTASVRASAAPARAAAHVLESGLDPWVRAAASALRADGILIAIVLATAIAPALKALERRFGETTLLPIHPRAGMPAHRLLIGAQKGRKGAPSVLPGLILHDGPDGTFAPAIEAILRGAATLSQVFEPWRRVYSASD